MFDSSDEQVISYDIETELKEENGKYVVTYIPSEEWIYNEERQFPITIDPTVTVDQTDADIVDGYVDPHNAYNNSSNNPSAALRYNYFGIYYFKCSTFLERDYANISSKLYLHINSFDGTPKLQARKLNFDWDPSTLTYINKPSSGSEVMDYVTVDNTLGAYAVLDITPYVQDLLNSNTNYGLEIGEFTGGGSCEIHTSGDNYNKPYIVTEFSALAGDYTDMSCHTASAGRAGTVTINDFTGNMQYEGEDLAIPGNRMPVSIKRVSTIEGASTEAGFAGAFYTNYHQRLQWDFTISKWKLRTDKGGYIFFNDDGNGNITDELNAGYKLSYSGGYTFDYTNITVTDPQGYTLYFNSYGNLVRIEDKPQADTSKILITYLGIDKIDQITDGAGGRYKFVYNGERISEIRYLGKTGDTVIKKVSYSFYKPLNAITVTTVTYNDQSSSTIETDCNHITRMINENQSGLKFKYYSIDGNDNNSNPNYYTRLKRVTEYGRNNVEGDYLEYSYSAMQTRIKDSSADNNSNKGNMEIYQFDRSGKVTSVRNRAGETVMPSYGGDNGQLLGFSDIRSTGIGTNLAYSFNFHSLSFQEHNHDDSIGVLVNKSYKELYTTYNTGSDVTMNIDLSQHTLRKGDTLLFGGWLKGILQGAGDGSDSNRGIVFEVQIGYTGAGTKTYQITPNYYVKDWQYVLSEIELEGNASSASMCLRINNQSNHINISTIEFKHIENKETGTSSSPKPTESNATPLPTAVCDSYGNVLSETDERGAVAEYRYDSAGSILTETKSADGKQLITRYGYDSDKNMVIRAVDSSGIGTDYYYNNDKTLHGQTDDGLTFETHGTTYQYDGSGNVTGMRSSYIAGSYFTETKGITVNYSYDDDRQTITTPNNEYMVLYNAFGDISKIKQGNNTLVEYGYAANNNSVITSTNYGNDQSITYSYDNKNRLLNDGQGSYSYDEQGNLIGIEDSINGTKEEFDDNKTIVRKLSNNSIIYKYDSNDNGYNLEKDGATIEFE